MPKRITAILDAYLKPKIDPALEKIGCALYARGISANAVTIAGAIVAVVAAGFIAQGHYLVGLALILLSRLSDGLDGAVARQAGSTDFGGYLDIVLDFLFYGIVPLAFIVADPQANAIAGATLLLSFYVNGASFLASAIMVEKRGISEPRGQKSFLFTTGLAEATETYVVFAAFCIMPHLFAPIAYVFAAICYWTALARILKTRAMLEG